MFHIWGFLAATWAPIYMRGTLVIMPKFEPEAVLAAFERHKVTVFMGGPASIYMGLMAHPNFAKTDFSNLRLCLAGGSACPEQMVRDWEAATGCVLLEGLGMSEGAPITCNPLRGERKFLSVGIVPPMTEIDIVDLATGEKVLGPGEPGEVRVKGPQFTQGYRNRPEENALALRGGWLYTGDIGYFDADGYLFLVDRKKDMVNVGGYNVFPREVDELMFRHPENPRGGGGRRARPAPGRAHRRLRRAGAGRDHDRGRVLRLLRGEPRQVQAADHGRLRRRAAQDRRRQDQPARAQDAGLDRSRSSATRGPSFETRAAARSSG